jgi:glycosyltransferase involved in cell wall biosynthesis
MKKYANIKVCHFASVHTIDDTRVFHRECTSLAQQFDVTLIGIGNFTGERNGVRIIGIPKPPSRIYRLLIVTWQVFFKAVSVNARIYHIHDAELLPFGILLSIFGKKVIYDIHENTFEDIRHKPWIPHYIKTIISAAYRIMEKTASWFMHYILVIAKPEFASCFSTNRYTIIQNFAEVRELTPYRVNKRSQLKDNHVFYMGTLHDMYYDFNKILEATYILKQQGIEVFLHCAGFAKNYQTNELPHSKFYKDIQTQITFYGHQTTEFTYALSRQCKMAICLKNQPAPILVSHERKFFEYLALGIPFICCDSHIYTDVLDKFKAGIAVDLTSPEAIAKAMHTLLTQPQQLDEMQAQCIAAVESTYNWQSQEKILLELYASLI